MKKRIILVAAMLIICAVVTVTVVTRPEPSGQELNADASVGAFRWGSTMEEVEAVVERKATELGCAVERSGNIIILEDYPIFGRKARLSLSFDVLSLNTYPTLSENTPLLLTNAYIFFTETDVAGIAKKISEVLGPADMDNEALNVWRSEESILDRVGMERMKSIYPGYDEEYIKERFGSFFSYVQIVTYAEKFESEGEGTLVEISAAANVIGQYLSDG